MHAGHLAASCQEDEEGVGEAVMRLFLLLVKVLNEELGRKVWDSHDRVYGTRKGFLDYGVSGVVYSGMIWRFGHRTWFCD